MSDNLLSTSLDYLIIVLLLVISYMIVKRFYQENFAVKKSKKGKKKNNKKEKKNSLYKFESHTFTSANKSGPIGPTIYELRNAYAGTNWAKKDNFFNMIVQGVQRWKVPVTGNYTIRAVGASGANPRTYCRGRDVQLKTKLKKGEILQIIVGQQGTMTQWSNGGAGGGTFVVRDFQTPIIIAGGGGGIASNEYQNSNASLYRSGNKGGDGSCSNCGDGGNNGTGGLAGSGYSGGGGGLVGNGTSSDYGGGGYSFLNGGVGGSVNGCNQNNQSGGSGGFGGGGASTCGGGAGGGGGYSGGGGGASPYWSSGGGGGSFGIVDLIDFGATNVGNGRVTITLNK
jgi:hypothetical protein